MISNSPEAILLDHANKFIANSNYSQSMFIHTLLLPSLINSKLEKPEDHKTGDEYLAWHTAKIRQVNSILNGHTRLPARWLWVWLDVLPEPYGSDARKELFAQGDSLDVSLSGLNVNESASADLPTLMREMADVLQAGSLVAADGKYDSNDDPEELKKLSNELTDVMEHCLSQILSINKAVDLSGTRAGVIVKSYK